MAAPELITEHPEFQALLPWAKAMAQAESAEQLGTRHVLLAAHRQSMRGELALSARVQQCLAAFLSSQPAPDVRGPAQDKMPLTAELKQALAVGAAAGFESWLAHLLNGDAPQAGADTGQPADPVSTSPEFRTLQPWLWAAMRSMKTSALSLPGLALAVHSAVKADALKEHVAFAHWCEGHADEFEAWLTHHGYGLEGLSPAAADASAIALDPLFAEALTKLDAEECAPDAIWKWMHAVVRAANEDNYQLQVAYHEAGHAVALHVLTPETVFTKITIAPEGNKGGYVASDRNDAFEQIYMNSLEQAMESIVVSLAGRAAEVRRFGGSRADSGAVNDMQKATLTAWQAITAFGLDPEFGPLSMAAVQNIDKGNPHLAPMADSGWLQVLAQQRLHAWLRWGMQEANALVEACWPMVESLALDLMKQKTLDNARAREQLGRWRAGSPPYVLRTLPAHA